LKLTEISDLTAEDIQSIFCEVGAVSAPARVIAPVAWSFEGRGVRTRATFIQAFRELDLAFTELPDLLKTEERVEDLAGYLDPLFSLYVVRESNHERLVSFAGASARPVINAMSSQEHPCEVLTDAFYIDRFIRPLAQARIGLWGPTETNVFRSWHQLGRLLGLTIIHIDSSPRPDAVPGMLLTKPRDLPGEVDVLITDVSGGSSTAPVQALSELHLEQMGRPALLPTPPFSIGRELGFDPVRYEGFVGYAQKRYLVPVQSAVIRFMLDRSPEH
jgi:hypothetical protein